MKVFVTGASGAIGSEVVKNLLTAGYNVIGLARSDDAAKLVSGLGAEVLRGDLEDVDILKHGVQQADGIIHTAFIHDFSQYQRSNEVDKAAITALGAAITGTQKPIITTGGIAGLTKSNGFATEDDEVGNSPRSSEATTMALAEAGVHASIVRLPPCVHGVGIKPFAAGFASMMAGFAKQKGVSAYVEEGANRWPAVHRLDAAQLYRLALEKAANGGRYNAVGDTGIAVKQIAEAIGKKLNLPVTSILAEETAAYFEWMGMFIGVDIPATAFRTQEQLGWNLTQIGLLEDIALNGFKFQ